MPIPAVRARSHQADGELARTISALAYRDATIADARMMRSHQSIFDLYTVAIASCCAG